MGTQKVVVDFVELATVAIIMFEHGDAATYLPSGIREQLRSKVTKATCIALGVEPEEFIAWINRISPMTVHENATLRIAVGLYKGDKERILKFLQGKSIEQKRATELVETFANT